MPDNYRIWPHGVVRCLPWNVNPLLTLVTAITENRCTPLSDTTKALCQLVRDLCPDSPVVVVSKLFSLNHELRGVTCAKPRRLWVCGFVAQGGQLTGLALTDDRGHRHVDLDLQPSLAVHTIPDPKSALLSLVTPNDILVGYGCSWLARELGLVHVAVVDVREWANNQVVDSNPTLANLAAAKLGVSLDISNPVDHALCSLALLYKYIDERPPAKQYTLSAYGFERPPQRVATPRQLTPVAEEVASAVPQLPQPLVSDFHVVGRRGSCSSDVSSEDFGAEYERESSDDAPNTCDEDEEDEEDSSGSPGDDDVKEQNCATSSNSSGPTSSAANSWARIAATSSAKPVVVPADDSDKPRRRRRTRGGRRRRGRAARQAIDLGSLELGLCSSTSTSESERLSARSRKQSMSTPRSDSDGDATTASTPRQDANETPRGNGSRSGKKSRRHRRKGSGGASSVGKQVGTVPCLFYYDETKGCPNGDKCNYMHDKNLTQAEAQRQWSGYVSRLQRTGKYKVLPCEFFLKKGYCHKGVMCTYVHKGDA